MSLGALVTIDLDAKSTWASSPTSVLLYLCVASLASLPGAMAGAAAGKWLSRPERAERKNEVSTASKAVIGVLGLMVLAGWIVSIVRIR